VQDINDFISQYGLTAAIVFYLLKEILTLIHKVGPDAWNFLKSDIADRRESKQKIEDRQHKSETLQLLAAQGSRTFTEEQLTQLTAESQVQLSEANEFIREQLAKNIDLLLQYHIAINSKLDKLPDNVSKSMREEMYEFRRISADISLIANILKRNLGVRNE
jgi:hypothetical protein